jgi:hypothetical protein
MCPPSAKRLARIILCVVLALLALWAFEGGLTRLFHHVMKDAEF